MRRVRWLMGVAGVTACIGLNDPVPTSVALHVLPEFRAVAGFAASVDQLIITVARVAAGTDGAVGDTVVRDTVPVDPVTGEAQVELVLVLLRNPETFLVTLEAVRGSDGLVLFGGSELIDVSGSSAATSVTVPVVWTGPPAATVVLSPSDTSVSQGSSYTISATVLDAQGGVIDGVVVFELETPGDSVDVTVERLSGRVSVAAGAASREVFIRGRTPDGVSARSRLFIGVVPGGVRVTPGFAALGVGATLPLAAALLDAQGQVISNSPSMTWTSRTTSVATVDAGGVVTGVAAGNAVIVGAAGGGFQDSVLVAVAPTGQVVVSAMGNDRGFAAVAVGDTIGITILADMRLTSESLGSYNATFTWNPADFQYAALAAGTFPAPTINTANVSTGELRFAQADPTGQSGAVVLARIFLVAQRPITAQPTLAISELSAAQTFTNLINSVTVVSGQITVR